MKNTYWNCADEAMRRRRDQDIVGCYARGWSLRRIADELNCAHETVRSVLLRDSPGAYRARKPKKVTLA